MPPTVPAAAVLIHQPDQNGQKPYATSCFHAPRAFHRARERRKKKGGEKRGIIRGVARKSCEPGEVGPTPRIDEARKRSNSKTTEKKCSCTERVSSRRNEREKSTRRGSDVSCFTIWRPCPGISEVAGRPVDSVERHWVRSGPTRRGGRLTAARASPPKSMAGTG
ncbi:hypothetical protein K0M31_013390 [Melipona bicolor]|uniref:Uncharacterized protein n=1 Tax=Melipona bicolor TaxID=60889 RepID=A0AA40FID0_9HYME|nr:hypothetical protein K0M31_013390 [Melipona bicolor]